MGEAEIREKWKTESSAIECHLDLSHFNVLNLQVP